MPASSTSISDLAPDSLAHIFAFLSLNERIWLEQVSQLWRQLVRKYGWVGFTRTLTLDKQELAQRGHRKALIRCRGLIDRCGLYLRELSLAALKDYDVKVDQWAIMPNLRHLCFDGCCVGSETLRAIADNLTRLQSIRFSEFDRHSVSVLHDLLRVDNASLQALRLPLSDNWGGSLRLRALPSNLRLLHISESYFPWLGVQERRDRVDELLELAVTCCPQLAILMLPMNFSVSELSLTKIAQFKKLFYLRLNFNLSHIAPFCDLLAKIGAQLRALLLEDVDARVLHLIAKHCPFLEHCYFGIRYQSSHEAEELLSALQSVFQIAHLRSVSIYYDYQLTKLSLRGTQILAAIDTINAKANLEYLHLSWGLSLHVNFIINLLQHNPKLRMLTCTMQDNNTHAQLDNLKMFLEELKGPVELELHGCHCPLEMGKDSRNRVRSVRSLEPISQPMLRQFWARAMMGSVPDLGKLDD